MKLEKLTVPVRCDNGACTRFAEYMVAKEGTPLNMQLKFCTQCAKELYALFGEAVKPKKKKTTR